MKKLFIICMIVSLMLACNALAATDSQPTSSNACTFDRSALLESPDGDFIIHIAYSSDEEYMEIFFGMQVDYSEDLTVVITDPSGGEHTADILNQDWSSLKVWTNGLEELKPHTLTITGVTARDAEAHPEYAQPDIYTATFITISPCCV